MYIKVQFFIKAHSLMEGNHYMTFSGNHIFYFSSDLKFNQVSKKCHARSPKKTWAYNQVGGMIYNLMHYYLFKISTQILLPSLQRCTRTKINILSDVLIRNEIFCDLDLKSVSVGIQTHNPWIYNPMFSQLS